MGQSNNHLVDSTNNNNASVVSFRDTENYSFDPKLEFKNQKDIPYFKQLTEDELDIFYRTWENDVDNASGIIENFRIAYALPADPNRKWNVSHASDIRIQIDEAMDYRRSNLKRSKPINIKLY